jgi:dTDP-4-dehydrorhamnose reductase
MKAAIIGTGFLGEQIYNDILPICKNIILTHHKNKKYSNSKEFDFFTDDIGKIFNGEKVDLVFLPAKIEFIEDEKLLRDAMILFLKACQKSRVIYISSDGIFDGEKGLYKESDIPKPITLYGKNLKVCEDLVKKYSNNFCIIRPSYLYGFVNSILDNRFKKIKEEVARDKKVVRFTDMFKSPLSYVQASKAITKLALSDYQGIVHVCGKRKNLYDFTKEGMEALDISTKTLFGEPMPEKRPLDCLPDTSLDSSLVQKLTGIKPFSIKESFKL